MDYNKRIKEKGLLKSYIANKLGISNVSFSYYLNKVRPIPEDIEKALKKDIRVKKFVLNVKKN